jgi:hypothetical protein
MTLTLYYIGWFNDLVLPELAQGHHRQEQVIKLPDKKLELD